MFGRNQKTQRRKSLNASIRRLRWIPSRAWKKSRTRCKTMLPLYFCTSLRRSLITCLIYVSYVRHWFSVYQCFVFITSLTWHGHMKKNSRFSSQRASLLERASRKILFLISLNLMYLALQLIVFRWKQIYFVLYFNENTFLSDFTIYFYDRNTFLMICGKCKIIPVSKISIWPCRKDKK